MDITHLCHACVALTAQGRTLVLDPPDPGYGYAPAFPDTHYVCTTHDHRDHCATELLPGAQILPRQEGPIIAGPFRVEAHRCFHDDRAGALRGENWVYKITADNVTVLHLGDLGHMPDRELLRFAAGADLLLAPVGGCFTLEPEAMTEVILALAPRRVLPIHYRTPKCSLQQLHPLDYFLALWDSVCAPKPPLWVCGKALTLPEKGDSHG